MESSIVGRNANPVSRVSPSVYPTLPTETSTKALIHPLLVVAIPRLALLTFMPSVWEVAAVVVVRWLPEDVFVGLLETNAICQNSAPAWRQVGTLTLISCLPINCRVRFTFVNYFRPSVQVIFTWRMECRVGVRRITMLRKKLFAMKVVAQQGVVIAKLSGDRTHELQMIIATPQ